MMTFCIKIVKCVWFLAGYSGHSEKHCRLFLCLNCTDDLFESNWKVIQQNFVS